MAGNEIIFAFNDLFNDDDRKIIVSYLLKHPIVWKYLDSRQNFELVQEHLGNELSNWTLLNILLSANQISPTDENIQAVRIDHSKVQPDNEKSNQEVQISDFRGHLHLLRQILKIYSEENDWRCIQDFLELKRIQPNELIERYGTLLSILMEIEPSSIKLLIENYQIIPSESASIIAANILNLSAINGHSLNNLFNNFKGGVGRNSRISVLRKLKSLGLHEQVVPLALKELEESTIKENQISNGDTTQKFDEELKQLSILKDQVELLNLVGQREQAEVTLNAAADKAKRITFVLDELRGEDHKKKPHNRLNYQSINNMPIEISHNGGSPSESSQMLQLNDQIKLFNKIFGSDRNAARQLAISIVKSFENIQHNDAYMNWIDLCNVDEIFLLLEKFLSMELIYESRDLANFIFQYYPQNIQIIKFMANINYQYGDRFSAIYYYGLIESLDELDKEEQIRFANALSDHDYWKQAEKIYAALSTTNQIFLANQLLCLYQSGQIEKALGLLKDHDSDFIHEDFFQVFSGLILDKVGRHIDAEEKINQATFKSESSDDACVLAAEFYIGKNDFHFAREVLIKGHEKNKGITRSAVKLVEILPKLENDIEAENIINVYFSDLSIHKEEVLKHILNMEDSILNPQLVREIILRNKKKWPLMPEVIAFQAHELLEDNQFKESKKLLEPLISRDPKNRKWITDYCLSIIKCSNQAFPLGIKEDLIEKLPPHKIGEIRELISEVKDSLPLQLIDFLFDSKNSLEELFQLKNGNEINSFVDRWLINAYIGKRYFDSNQYDRAIIYLEKAAANNSNHVRIHLCLITAYLKLNLWHEAQEQVLFIYPKIRNNLVLLKCIFDDIRDQKTRLEILHKLEIIDHGNQILEVMHGFEKIRIKDFQGIKDQLQQIITTQYLTNELLIFMAQLLIESGEKQLAAWAINKILSSKDIREKEYISAAILFFQMNEMEKSFQCASLTHARDSLGRTVKAWLQINSNLEFDHDALMIDINQLVKKSDDLNLEYSVFSLIIIPPTLLTAIENPVQLIYELIRSLLKKNLLEKAIDVASSGLESISNEEKLIALWLEMCSILDGGHNIASDSKLSDMLNRIEFTHDFDLQCNLLEFSLTNNNEVQVAQHLARMDEKSSEKPRVQLISARLLVKTGNWGQAQTIIDGIYEEYKTKSIIPENCNDLLTNTNIIFSSWFLDAASELKDHAKVLEICNTLCDKGLMTSRIIEIFLMSLVSFLEVNDLLNRIGIRNRKFSLKDLKIESAINKITVRKNEFENKSNQLLLHYCKFLLNEKESEDREYIEAHIDELEPKSYIYAANQLNLTYLIEEKKNANDADAYFYNAVLNYKEDPAFAFSCITELLIKYPIKEEYYLILSFIKQNDGSIEEAFSAINLALDINNENPSLLARAGELAELLGDDLSAIRYFERTIHHNRDNQLENKLINLYIKTETKTSLNFIEERLSRYIQDGQVLKFLAESYLTKKDFRKATYYADQLIKRDFSEATILKSRIACELGNIDKADEILSRIDVSDRRNNDFITQQAVVLEAKGMIQSAIDYLNETKPYPTIDDDSIIILKAKLLEKQFGSEASLQYLESIDEENQNSSIKLFISDILIHQGQLDEAQLLIEKGFEKEPKNSELHAKMALIAKERGDLDQAVNFLVNSIINNPYASKYYIELAQIYSLRREMKKGMDILKEAQMINPHDEDLTKALREVIQYGSRLGSMNTFEPQLIGSYQ